MSWEALQVKIGCMKREIRAWATAMQLWMLLLGLEIGIFGVVLICRGMGLGWLITAAVLGLCPAAAVWIRRRSRELCAWLELLPYTIFAACWLAETKTE